MVVSPDIFTIRFLRRGQALWVRWSSARGQGDAPVTPPGPMLAPATIVERRLVGKQLFAALCAEGSGLRIDLVACLQAARGQQQGLVVRLVFDEQTAPEAQHPWELLHDGDQYLLLNGVELVRSLALERHPAARSASLPLRILALAASPAQAEGAVVALRAINGLSVATATLAADAPHRLSRDDDNAPLHVLHIASRAAFLDLEPSVFENKPILLTVVSFSGVENATDAGGVAPVLLRAGSQAVVVVQGALSDSVSLRFFTTLYSALTQGAPLRNAVASARKRLVPFEEWHKPALYLHPDDALGQLFTPSDAAPVAEAVHAQPSPAALAAVPHERLYQEMKRAFIAWSDIDTICFRFGLAYDSDLRGSVRNDKIWDLIQQLEARHQYPALVRAVIQERPSLRERLFAPLAANQADNARTKWERSVPPGHNAFNLAPADLHLRLKLGPDGSNEVEARFQLPSSADDKELIVGDPPRVTLNQGMLLEHSSKPDRYGDALTSMFFADKRLTSALLRARDQAKGAGVSLRIRLQYDDSLLDSVRWELLRDPTTPSGGYICTDSRLLFSRYLASAEDTEIRLRHRQQATALVAIAAPTDLEEWKLPPIDKEREQALIRPALEGIQTTYLERTTLASLVYCLHQAEPALLYLLCHGTIANGQPYLWLEDDDGKAHSVLGSVFIDHIRKLKPPPLLIVLASCQSAGESSYQPRARVALGPQLARAGVGAVVAMHDNVAISTVQEGMPVFFNQLLRHGRVDEAMVAMRDVLATRHDDWWQPVLFLRLRDGQLFR